MVAYSHRRKHGEPMAMALQKAGVKGVYGNRDGFFHEINNEKECHRLRAAIHMQNGKFANYMRQHGQKRKVVSVEYQEDADTETGQILVTKEQMSAWIKKVRSLPCPNSTKLTATDIRPYSWLRTSGQL